MAATALAAAGLVIGVGSSLFGSSSRNKAAKAQSRAQIAQAQDLAEIERRRRMATAQQVRGRQRIIAGDSGFDFEGSWDDLERFTDLNEALDLDLIDRNLLHQIALAKAGLRLNTVNPFISGAQGGLQGFQTGLQIGDYFDQRAAAAAAQAGGAT